jgi:hypothetical protein
MAQHGVQHPQHGTAWRSSSEQTYVSALCLLQCSAFFMALLWHGSGCCS